MPSNESILVTGATGQLGRLIIDRLLEKVPASRIVASMRDAGKAGDLASRGVEVRPADYNDPASLDVALAGVGKLLLISSSEVGARVPQHRNVIDAAARARVGLIAYTSILHADTSPMGLASEHRATEALLAASGVPFVLLRNGWYNENHLASLAPALQYGAVTGSAGDGKVSSAARADFADAAVAVLAAPENQAGRIYELAGDDSWTLTDFAAEIARQTGKSTVYNDVPEAEYKAILLGAGLPEPLAAIFSESDTGTAKGGLFDDGRQLGMLIGRPTTPLAASIAKALANA